MKYNYDDKRRCEIIGMSYPPEYLGGCKSFEGLTLSQLNLLLDENFIDPEECQNYSPNTMEFKAFLDAYPEATLHGYIISPERGDYRVTIEGLEYRGDVSKELLSDFIDTFRMADDFIHDEDYLYCWFD
jgi:hypothetical protein